MSVEYWATQAVVVLIIVLSYRVAMGVVRLFWSREAAQAEAVAHGAGRYYLDDQNRITFRWNPPRIDECNKQTGEQ